MRKLIACILLLCLCAGLCACGKSAQPPAANGGTELEQLCAKATTIALSGTGAEIKGPGAHFENGVVTISTGGAYLVSGSLDNGRLQVDTGEEKQKVQLILDGASIACADGAALYIERAGETDIYLTENGESRLISGVERELEPAAAEASGAALYAEDDVELHGPGTLRVEGYINNGIGGKNDVDIKGGVLIVRAVNSGVKGNEAVDISGGEISIECVNDGLKTEDDKDEGKGSVNISGGVLSVSAGDQGICAVRDINISGGTLDIRSEGDAFKAGSKTAPGMVNISGGEIQAVSGNDAVDAGALNISGGSLMALGRDKDIRPAVKASVPCYAGKFKAEAGDSIAVLDENGGSLCTVEPGREIKSAFLALPGMKAGESYKLMTGPAADLRQTGNISLS